MEKQFPTIDKVKTGKQIRHLMDSLGLTVMDVQKYMGLATHLSKDQYIIDLRHM